MCRRLVLPFTGNIQFTFRLLISVFLFYLQASLDLYSRILDVIERNDYDNFRKRAFTTKFEKLSILPSSWLTVNSVKKAKK